MAGRPESRPLYAVGDVHGCRRELALLWERIEADATARLPAGARTRVVFLGDYIDRGPDSRGVLEWLDRLRREPPAWCEPVFLLGNHELLMLEALRSEKTVAHTDWMLCGGGPTLESFGIREPEPARAVKLLRARVRGALAEFFEAAKLYHREPGWLFVHAGLRPGVPLEHQTKEDLVWIRYEFLRAEDDHGFRVVHGHTPTRDGAVEIRPNRVNVDTGAYRGGPLSAVRLEGDQVAVLQVAGSGEDYDDA